MYHSVLRKLNNKHRQVVMFLPLLFKLSSQLPFVSFSFLSISILTLFPFSTSLFPLSQPLSSPFPISTSLSTIRSFSSDRFSVLLSFKFNFVSLLSEVTIAHGSSALPSPFDFILNLPNRINIMTHEKVIL